MHFLVSMAYLFGSVDDKVASDIKRTLLELIHLTSRGLSLVQHTVLAAQHDGNLAKVLLSNYHFLCDVT